MDTGVAPDSLTQGSFIAYHDTDAVDDPNSKRFHLVLITNVADGETHVLCHATATKRSSLNSDLTKFIYRVLF